MNKKISYIYKVENKDRYKTANPFYYHIKTYAGDFLFTLSDMKQAKERASNNPEDIQDTFFEKHHKLTFFMLGLFFGSIASGLSVFFTFN